MPAARAPRADIFGCHLAAPVLKRRKSGVVNVVTKMHNAEQWTTRLAALLAGAGDPKSRYDALRDLAATHKTGNTQIDETRQTILQLLAQIDDLAFANPTDLPEPAEPTVSGNLSHLADRPDPAVPTDPADAARPHILPLLSAHQGRLGVSMVAVNLAAARLSVGAVRNWLTSQVDELVLVDAQSTAPLAGRLRAAGITDPRLTVLRLDGSVTWTQAFNIGFRATCHARIWAISGTIRFASQLAHPSALPPGCFANSSVQPEPEAFLLDLHRADLAATGGFNEYIDTADGAVLDLAGRLSDLQLTHSALPPGLLTTGPKTARKAVPATTGTLRDTLRQTPGFAALQNHWIAAAMPDWTGGAQLPCHLDGQDDLGQHVQPGTPAHLPTPQVKAMAATHAIADMLRDRFGGHPERLGTHQLDLVLDRPDTDVFATDLAVAAGRTPELVTTRNAWLGVAMAADCLPVPGSAAALGLATLLQMAENHGQTPVLHVDTVETAVALGDMTACPVVTNSLETTAAFLPTDLRELARPLGDRAPRHATFAFNQQTLADLQRLALCGPSVLLRRPKIFIDAQHGLGNRMRAIASAGAIAEATNRELVIIWAPDAHCDCTYEDLFFPDGAVLSQGFAEQAQSMGMNFYNYMQIEPGAVKDAPIVMGAFQDTYLRSASPLVSPFSTWKRENAWIPNLKPNAVVRALVSSVRNPNDLSIHIRMQGGTDAEHLAYESASNWTAEAHEQIDYWRKRSHYRHFLPRVDQLIAEGSANSMFLAADTPEVYAAFEARYGNQVTWLPRPMSDRSAQSLVYAMADAILLSRAPRKLGSTWSSFSELAARLSPATMRVELSGRDF